MLLRNILTSAAMAAGLTVGAASAQDWPAKSIRIVSPYAAGSTGELVARLVGEAIEADLGQRVLVETQPGGAGNVGAASVASSAPDGYTFLLGATNNFAINQYLFKLPFDPIDAFEPVSILLDVPSVVLLNPSVPVNNMQELAAYAKEHANEMNFGSPGQGTTPHLSVEQFKIMAGIEMTHIPYTGGGPAMTALLSNEVQLMFLGAALGKPHIEAGSIKALAVGSKERLPSLPDTPTTIEAGFPDLQASNWWGLAAPKGTDPAILSRLQQLIAKAMATDSLKKRISDLGFVAVASTPDEMKATISREAKLWSETIEKANIKIQ